ncbi:MAG: hypothetical protein E6I95_13235 [Chloroflexi bacterium]|nr:MAG: hypothetical protein E6I95_13235 [Chloroflexota bacterium]
MADDQYHLPVEVLDCRGFGGAAIPLTAPLELDELTTIVTSGSGSATSWTPSGSGSSSRLIGPSETRTFKKL